MPTARLRIPALKTAADEALLRQTVRAVTGVYGVVASCSDRCADVDFDDDEATIREILDAADAAGFAATLAG